MRRVAALFAALCLCSAPALANGRFPLSNQIAKSSALPSSLLVRTSFGLLTSTDGGKSFSWICEGVIGYGGTQDPGIALFGDGSMAVAAFEGLTMSHDGGCTWTRVADDGVGGQYVIDVAAERELPARGVAITSTGLSPAKFYVQTYETADSGRSWSKVGVELPSDLLSETIDVAPSNPQRMYVSGVIGQGPERQGVLEASGDRGATWERHIIPLDGDQSVFIAGLDPVDDKRLYLRTRGINDRLLVSDDAGVSFRELGRTIGAMTGFAIHPTGARVAFGGPTAGLFLGPRDATTFANVGEATSVCLFWAGEGLYACGADYNDGYVVGRSDDDAKTFVPVLPTLSAIKGPLTTCASDSDYVKKCSPAWPALADLFGVGSESGGAGAGGAGAVGAAGAAVATAARGATETEGGGGCGVRSAGSPGSAWLTLLALASVCGVAARRSKR